MTDLLYESVNALGKPVTIILGAIPSESHIVAYATAHPDETVVTISDNSAGDEIVDIAGIYYVQMDFNDIGAWEANFCNMNNVSKVITDWSTSKFFNMNYNIVTGKVFQFIKNLLCNDGCFYAPYRSGLRMLIQEYDGKPLPRDWQYIAIAPSAFLSCNIMEDPNLTKYKSDLVFFGAQVHEAQVPGEYPLDHPYAAYPVDYLTYRRQ